MKYKLAERIEGVGDEGAVIHVEGRHLLDGRGRKIAAELTPDDVHDATEIATYLQGVANRKFRADEVSRPIPFGKTVGLYTKTNSDDAFEPVQVKVGITAWLPEIAPSLERVPFAMQFRGVCSFVNDVTEAEAAGTSAYRPRMQAAKKCLRVLQIDRELDVWNLLTTAANWDADNVNSLTSGYEWNAGVNSDPILDMQNAEEDSDDEITDWWMNLTVAHDFLRHPAVRDSINSFYGNTMLPAMLKDLSAVVSSKDKTMDFDVPGIAGRIHVVGARYKNSSGDKVPIMGNHVVGTVESDPQPSDGDSGNTTVSFRYSAIGGGNYVTREERLALRGVFGGTMMLVSMGDVPLLTGPTLGALIRNAHQ